MYLLWKKYESCIDVKSISNKRKNGAYYYAKINYLEKSFDENYVDYIGPKYLSCMPIYNLENIFFKTGNLKTTKKKNSEPATYVTWILSLFIKYNM